MGLRKFIRRLRTDPYRADRAEVLTLIRKLRPVTTDIPLIRMGGAGDGGYLVPDDLAGIDVCFSPGVSFIADFERDCAERGMSCYLADASVAAPPVMHERFHFDRKFLGSRDEGAFMTLDAWVGAKAPGASDLLLQIDIEGAEYRTLLTTSPEVLRRFRIIVAEFHDLHRLTDRLSFELIGATFDRLLRDFHVVHIHPNNCMQPRNVFGVSTPPVMELTLLRKDRAAATGFAATFPHPLDGTNLPKRKDFALPEAWYK